MLTEEFARRIDRSRVTVNAVLPGLVNTAQMASMRGMMRWLIAVMRPFLLTPEQGARTPLWVATTPELAGVTGTAFGRAFGNGRREFRLPPHIRDRETCARFFALCEQAAEQNAPKSNAA